MKALRHTAGIFCLCLFLCSTYLAAAQSATARKETRKGNKEYKQEHYDKAEVNYRRALHNDSTAHRAHYNLGNTLYRQKKYDEAASHYDKALYAQQNDSKARSQTLHNRGNCNLQAGLAKENRADGMQQFQKAVNDYQEALKIDPKNNDTRYNLSYAKKLLRQAQQQQQQQQNDKNQQQDNKDKKQDNKNQQGNNDPKDQQEQQQDQDSQQNEQQQNRQEQERQKQQQQQKMQDAERLLEAVKNNEKNTMKDNTKRVESAASHKIEKDW